MIDCFLSFCSQLCMKNNFAMQVRAVCASQHAKCAHIPTDVKCYLL
jgi:hypothetical protein